MKTYEFTIRVEVHDDVSKATAREYVREAVQSWKGCYRKCDPIFYSFDRVWLRYVKD